MRDAGAVAVDIAASLTDVREMPAVWPRSAAEAGDHPGARRPTRHRAVRASVVDVSRYGSWPGAIAAGPVRSAAPG
ncbi:MAG TPA: hypothetical protein VIQ11_04290 [Mycobacterium sp.]